MAVIAEGYGWKQGQKLGRWTKRFYVITQNEVKYSEKPKGKGKTLKVDPKEKVVNDDKGGKFGFTFAASDGRHAVYLDDAVTRDAWVASLTGSSAPPSEPSPAVQPPPPPIEEQPTPPADAPAQDIAELEDTPKDTLGAETSQPEIQPIDADLETIKLEPALGDEASEPMPSPDAAVTEPSIARSVSSSPPPRSQTPVVSSSSPIPPVPPGSSKLRSMTPPVVGLSSAEVIASPEASTSTVSVPPPPPPPPPALVGRETLSSSSLRAPSPPTVARPASPSMQSSTSMARSPSPVERSPSPVELPPSPSRTFSLSARAPSPPAVIPPPPPPPPPGFLTGSQTSFKPIDQQEMDAAAAALAPSLDSGRISPMRITATSPSGMQSTAIAGDALSESLERTPAKNVPTVDVGERLPPGALSPVLECREDDEEVHIIQAPGLDTLYELKEKLGTGGYGVVRAGREKKTGNDWAVKIIPKATVDANKEQIMREVKIMSKLMHPNLVRLHEVVEADDALNIVMELLRGKELFDAIVERGSYSEREASAVLRKIVGALAYMHNSNIAHCDLKPENLVYSSTDDTAEVKIIDFGLAHFTDKPTSQTISKLFGTPEYIAPEVISRGGYSPSCDMWGVGVIMYILLCGYFPFYGNSPSEIFGKVTRGKYDFPSAEWDGVSESAKELISKLLVVDTSKRLTALQCLRHPWMRGVSCRVDVISLKTLQNLKQFNAKRKFKTVQKAVLFPQMLLANSWRKPKAGDAPPSPEMLPQVSAVEAAAEESDAVCPVVGPFKKHVEAGQGVDMLSLRQTSVGAMALDLATLNIIEEAINEAVNDSTQHEENKTTQMKSEQIPLEEAPLKLTPDTSSPVKFVPEVASNPANAKPSKEKAQRSCFSYMKKAGLCM